MIAIPGFAVSTEVAERQRQVQPIPNPAYTKPTTWLEDFKKLYPDEVEKNVVVCGEGLPVDRSSTRTRSRPPPPQSTDIEVRRRRSRYGLMGQDSVAAQKVIDSGATGHDFVGEPANLSSLLRAQGQGWKGIAILETNKYDRDAVLPGPTWPRAR